MPTSMLSASLKTPRPAPVRHRSRQQSARLVRFTGIATIRDYSKRIARVTRLASVAVTKETERSNAVAAWMRFGWTPTGGAEGGLPSNAGYKPSDLRTETPSPQIAIPFPASSSAIPAAPPC